MIVYVVDTHPCQFQREAGSRPHCRLHQWPLGRSFKFMLIALFILFVLFTYFIICLQCAPRPPRSSHLGLHCSCCLQCSCCLHCSCLHCSCCLHCSVPLLTLCPKASVFTLSLHCSCCLHCSCSLHCSVSFFTVCLNASLLTFRYLFALFTLFVLFTLFALFTLFVLFTLFSTVAWNVLQGHGPCIVRFVYIVQCRYLQCACPKASDHTFRFTVFVPFLLLVLFTWFLLVTLFVVEECHGVGLGLCQYLRKVESGTRALHRPYTCYSVNFVTFLRHKSTLK